MSNDYDPDNPMKGASKCPHCGGLGIVVQNDELRAVCGLPLGSTERLVPAAAMANLLGDLWQAGPPDWSAALAEPDLRLHLYGKDRPRPGRKMGHLTVVGPSVEAAEQHAVAARLALRPRSEPAGEGLAT